MPFQLSRRIFLVSAVLCTLLRVWLHLTCIDPESGFYNGSLPLVLLYYILLGASVVALLALGLRAKPKNPYIAVTPILRLTMLLASLGAAILAVPTQAKILGPDYLPHPPMLVILRLFTLSIIPLLTAIFFIYLAVQRGRELARLNGYVMMLPALWMATVLVTRFMDYTASRHVSDQMLVIVTLCFATLFLLPLGRIAAGLTPLKTAQQLMAFAPPFSLLAFSVCGGILAGPRIEIPLALSTPEAIAVVLLGLFAAAIAFCLRESE